MPSSRSPRVTIKRGILADINRSALATPALNNQYQVQINVNEVKNPQLQAILVGQNIAQQLEKKVNYRRVAKKTIQSTMSMGAEGIKICIAGRLNGADIARSETFREGRVPLHTLRADIDYAHVEALTTYGIIGIKTWIYKGEIR